MARLPKSGTCFLVLLLTITAAAVERPEAMQHARASFELSKRGDLPGAAEEMRTAIRLAPANPLYWSALGGIVARQGKAEEAKDCFERAVKLDPKNPALRFHLARLQSEAGDLAPARENLAAVVDAQPDDREPREMLEEVSLEYGASLAKQRRFRLGVLVAEDTARRFPESARAQQMLGLFLTRNQQNPAAVTAYQRAISLAPELADLSVGLGVAQTMAGSLPEAVQTLEAGIRKWPEDAMHYQAYGVLLLRMAAEGLASEHQAAAMLHKALTLNSSLVEAHYQLGNLALVRGEAGTAIEHLRAALRNGDDSSKVHFALSRAYRAGGEGEQAETHSALFQERKLREQQAELKK